MTIIPGDAYIIDIYYQRVSPADPLTGSWQEAKLVEGGPHREIAEAGDVDARGYQEWITLGSDYPNINHHFIPAPPPRVVVIARIDKAALTILPVA